MQKTKTSRALHDENNRGSTVQLYKVFIFPYRTYDSDRRLVDNVDQTHNHNWLSPDKFILKFHGMLTCLYLFYYDGDDYRYTNDAADFMCRDSQYRSEFYFPH